MVKGVVGQSLEVVAMCLEAHCAKRMKRRYDLVAGVVEDPVSVTFLLVNSCRPRYLATSHTVFFAFQAIFPLPGSAPAPVFDLRGGILGKAGLRRWHSLPRSPLARWPLVARPWKTLLSVLVLESLVFSRNARSWGSAPLLPSRGQRSV